MSDENPLGIMLYGYDERQAAIIKLALDKVTGEDVLVVSGSGQEGEKVRRILDKGPTGVFEAKDVRVLMFIGFDDGQVKSSLGGFPREEGLERPLFCGLTPHNLEWDLGDLIGHLQDEKRQFDRMKGKGGDRGGEGDSQVGGE